MKTVTEALGKHGTPLEFTSKSGKVYKIHQLTLKSIAAFEQKMVQRAIKTLSDSKEVLGADTFKELFRELLNNISSGMYAFGGETCTKTLATITGFSDLVSIMIESTPEEAMDLCMIEKDTFVPLIDEVIRYSVGYDPKEESEGEQKKEV